MAAVDTPDCRLGTPGILTEGGGTNGGVRSGVSGGGAPGGKRGTGDPLGGGTPWPATRRSERACASAAFIAEELS